MTQTANKTTGAERIVLIMMNQVLGSVGKKAFYSNVAGYVNEAIAKLQKVDPKEYNFSEESRNFIEESVNTWA